MTGFEPFGQEWPLATAEDLAVTEKSTGRPLPRRLREMLRTSRNGGRVRANQLASHPEVGVDNFLRAGLEGADTISARWQELGDELPEWFLPIADCSCGNLLGMDDEGRIFFWDHEEPDAERSVTPVAASLSALERDVRPVVVPPDPDSGAVWVNPAYAEALERWRRE